MTAESLILYVSMALLAAAPVKQFMILLAGGGDIDVKGAFLAHGLASFGAPTFRAFELTLESNVCLLVIGVVSFWVYWVRPTYKS